MEGWEAISVLGDLLKERDALRARVAELEALLGEDCEGEPVPEPVPEPSPTERVRPDAAPPGWCASLRDGLWTAVGPDGGWYQSRGTREAMRETLWADYEASDEGRRAWLAGEVDLWVPDIPVHLRPLGAS